MTHRISIARSSPPLRSHPMQRSTFTFLLACLFAFSSCGDDGEATPTDDDDDAVVDDSTAGDGTTEGSGPDDATGTTGPSETEGTDEDSGTGGPDDECFAGIPETPEQLFNQCTDAACEPFDNSARLPLLNDDGSLPPIP